MHRQALHWSWWLPEHWTLIAPWHVHEQSATVVSLPRKTRTRPGQVLWPFCVHTNEMTGALFLLSSLLDAAMATTTTSAMTTAPPLTPNHPPTESWTVASRAEITEGHRHGAWPT